MTTTGAASAGSEPADPERLEAVHALEGSFSELMGAFRRYLTETAERVSPGMLPGSFKVLSTVFRFGPLTLSALAERLASDKGMVSRGVSELEDLGLVTRTPDPGDRRSRLIAVTPLGERRLSAARAPAEGHLFAILEDWSVGDIRQLTTLLHALAVGTIPSLDAAVTDGSGAIGRPAGPRLRP